MIWPSGICNSAPEQAGPSNGSMQHLQVPSLKGMAITCLNSFVILCPFYAGHCKLPYCQHQEFSDLLCHFTMIAMTAAMSAPQCHWQSCIHQPPRESAISHRQHMALTHILHAPCSILSFDLEFMCRRYRLWISRLRAPANCVQLACWDLFTSDTGLPTSSCPSAGMSALVVPVIRTLAAARVTPMP